MNGEVRTVFIVDDAREVRAALSRVLTIAGYQVYSFESAERYLDEEDAKGPGCLLLDICMPGLSGIDLQRSLVGSPRAMPTTVRFVPQFSIVAEASKPIISSTSSTRLSRQRKVDWDWDSRYPTLSSWPTGGGCGPQTDRTAEPLFTSHYR